VLSLSVIPAGLRPPSSPRVTKSDGKAEFELAVKEAESYRLEAWLELDGAFRPWIFANPIYVR
jgi:hypothetical protein